jgi:hypothetical protein
MRILFIHAGDDPMHGPWAFEPWNLVVDMGIAGADSYSKWKEWFGCSVVPLGKSEESDFDGMRKLLALGLGAVVDAFGLDWHDLISTSFYERVELAFRLQNFTEQVPPNSDIAVSRRGLESHILTALLDQPVRCFSSTNGAGAKFQHYAHELSRLPIKQLIQIAGDKYDAGYQWRRFFTRRPQRCSRPVILLPTNYVNVSRTGLQYAESLPDSDFLLVSTRQSGLIKQAPANVSVRKLASYAPGTFDESELRELLIRFQTMRSQRMGNAISALIYEEIGRSFPQFLRDGLMVRNAWLQLFEQERISAVLCADDANHTTRIPLLIAREKKLPALSCHHGALDGRYRLRLKPDTCYLAKGRMERDYLSRVCAIREDVVEIGGAGKALPARSVSSKTHSIVFFSENYEALGGRGQEFYRDLLPPLSDLALKTGRELVVKLHPAEVVRTRKRMAKNVLPSERFNRVRFVQGPLSENLLNSTWFGITVISSTAIDCTRRGIPVFLCPWLEYCNYGYAEQMLKFRAGVRLNHAGEIPSIPALLESLGESRTSDLWQAIVPEHLQDLLRGTSKTVRELVSAAG